MDSDFRIPRLDEQSNDFAVGNEHAERADAGEEGAPDVSDGLADGSTMPANKDMLDEARAAVEASYADHTEADTIEIRVASDAVSDRTYRNRIDLADDVRHTELTPTYGGYLDVVLHGDESGTQADIEGRRVDLDLDDMQRMIQTSPEWERRPIRLLSCSTGASDLAQNLADRIGRTVYAPSDTLYVDAQGKTWVGNGGNWKRFEPKP